MDTYLILGGAGFIGSHLTERLLKEGHKVIVIDDFSSGSPDNLASVADHPDLVVVPECLEKPGLLDDMVESTDVVVHLAATVGVLNIIDRPVRTIVNNVGGTRLVLEASARHRTKVIVTSTSEVYGKAAFTPFREGDDLLLGPSEKARWSYAASKLVDEFLALAFWREGKVPTVIIRPFNTIGPRQIGAYGMVVPRFFAWALKGEDLQVTGTGRQTRSFTYVDDIIEWIVRLAKDDRAVGQVYNLGNVQEISIKDLARMVIDVTGSSSRVQYVRRDVAYKEGFEDIERRVPDIQKVVELTGYSPQVEMMEALRRTRNWFVNANILDKAVNWQHT